MPLFQTPRSGRTRAQSREIMANETKMKLEAGSDVQYNRKSAGKILSDIVATQDGGAHSREQAATCTSHASSSSATRQKRLEYKAAQARAIIELKEAQAEMTKAKARIEKELLEKKLAADLAHLEDSRCSKQSSSISCKSRVEKWLEQSVNAPGSSLERNVAGENCVNGASRPRQPTDQSAGTQPAIEALTNAIKDAISASTSKSTNHELLSRLAICKDLPIYSGDPMEWLHFKGAFYESTRLCNYTDSENLWRLRKCLRGEAKESASSLLMSATSPQEILETLELRFGRPENIMRTVTQQLRKLQPLPHAYHTEIVNFAIKVKNYVTATRTVQQSDYLRSPELVTIVVSKLPTELINKWADYLYQYDNQDDTPKLEILSKFLHQEAKKVAITGVSYVHSQIDPKPRFNTEKYKNHKQSVLVCAEVNPSTSDKCKYCKKPIHKLTECSRFKHAMRKDRWRYVRINKLCFKCLGDRHENHSECTAENCDVEACGGPHHRLLHWVKPQAARQAATEPLSQSQQPDADAAVAPRVCTSSDELVAHTIETRCSEVSVLNNSPEKCKVLNVSKIVLKIVPVTIHGPKQSVHAHALLDDGATVSLIAADIADKAGLHGECVTMRATSAWDSSELVCKTEILNLDISNSDGNKFKLRARKLKELNLPVQSTSCMDFSEYENLYNFKFNSCNCDIIKPTLLIGQDNYDLIAPIVCKKFEPHGPFITQTLLGWCVHGALFYQNGKQRARARFSSGASDSHLLTIPACTTYPQRQPATFKPLNTYNKDLPIFKQNNDNIDLHELIRRSFSLDSIGICNNPRQNIEETRALNILNESAELIGGQWTVGLPWKSDVCVMPDSYSVALKRLKSVERKMLSDSEYESRYRERMTHLFQNNYARRLSESECRDTLTNRTWYLPHFGVDNPNKKKLRLVFDAAAKSNDFSLNDFLLQGPDLLNSLYGIMFRFRENYIGVIGDIKDMFLRIKIKNDDQNALRFLWREKGSDEVNKYVMTSLIFGANCSPFIAQFINQDKNASLFQEQMTDAVNAIKLNQYMDDYIDSFTDLNVASKTIKDVSYIHKQGGFEMRNWLSNVPTVLSEVPKETLNDKAIRFNIDNQPERALGLLWFPSTDMLAFDLSFKRVPQDVLLLKRIPTKRELLCIVMSIYDIHGYLSPFTIKGKILMRKVWEKNLNWDDKLSDDLYDLFREWISQAQEINNIRIPRWYFSTDLTSDSLASLEIHVFCDASPSAYAAVAYWRRETINGRVSVSFIASKCKVTPLKPVSVPRLELQGAVLACKLANSIKKEHRLQPNSVHYWTDSTTVLYWIKNQCRTYKVFIANRLGEIDELSKVDEWHYVPTDLNVADLGTKNTDYVLSSDSTWFSGPSFLYQPTSYWPQQPEIKIITSDDKILERINTVGDNNHKIICDLPVPDPTRFSRWLRLLRATATVLLFIEKCKKRSITCITVDLMHKAEMLLLYHSQLQSFRSEINLLKSNKEITRESRLRTLTPIIDENNLLRVGGRIGNAKDVDQLTKFPIILDGKNHIARLIVLHYHVNAAHSCNEMIINELRQKYWIVNLRPTVKTVAKHCLICRFRKTLPNPPRLGDLPECRLTHHQRPFTMCGVDLFGPLEVVVGRQRVRRYGVLFTCLTVRAVHLELVSSLTTDSMIMALRRMAARRGWPHTVFSDNGTNLRGADVELKKAYQEVIDHQPQLVTEALNKGVHWQFIPPASPHMGGAWERLIRSVKTALKVVLKERTPREETLSTFLCEVENMVNSRPLTHVSVDPRDSESLTPNHFLIGSSSNLPQPGRFDDKDLLLRKQWRIAQRLADLFWSRWMKEVLPTLAPRKKWNREGAQLKVGDLVVVVDPASPRNVWPKGIVQTIYPGPDGRVRVLDIRTKTGIMKRPASRIALLQSDDECRNDNTEGQDVSDDGRLNTVS